MSAVNAATWRSHIRSSGVNAWHVKNRMYLQVNVQVKFMQKEQKG